MTPLQERFKEAIEKQDLTITHEVDGIHITKLSPVEIHAAAIACEAITIEHMGKFAEWASGNTYDMIGEQNEFGEELWENYSYEDQHSTPDLIKLYFESLNPNPQ